MEGEGATGGGGVDGAAGSAGFEGSSGGEATGGSTDVFEGGQLATEAEFGGGSGFEGGGDALRSRRGVGGRRGDAAEEVLLEAAIDRTHATTGAGTTAGRARLTGRTRALDGATAGAADGAIGTGGHS